jgi:hypothetical protein
VFFGDKNGERPLAMKFSENLPYGIPTKCGGGFMCYMEKYIYDHSQTSFTIDEIFKNDSYFSGSITTCKLNCTLSKFFTSRVRPSTAPIQFHK